jgi:tRNA1(Val) A37 N6-methylase TrmN6
MEGNETGTTAPSVTEDAFLGGRLRLLQPRAAYRAGLDAVLLAAAADARPGERVLDVGAGVGTVGLCLAVRTGAEVVLLEPESRLAALAEENARRNGLVEGVRVACGRVGLSGREAAALGLDPESFDHVLANPPYHDRARGTAATDASKAGAHAMSAGDLDIWARFMARMAAPGGAATVIHKAEALPAVLAAFASRFGALKVLALQPRVASPANRILIQGVKGSRAPLVLLPPFIVHEAGQAFRPEAEAILRDGAALPLGGSESLFRAGGL